MLTWKWVLGLALATAIACCISNRWITVESNRSDDVSASAGLTSATVCFDGNCSRFGYGEGSPTRRRTQLLVLGTALKVATGLAAMLLLVMWVSPAKATTSLAIALLVVGTGMLVIFGAWYVFVRENNQGESHLGPPLLGFLISTLAIVGASIALLVSARKTVPAATATAP